MEGMDTTSSALDLEVGLKEVCKVAFKA
jgi:hypothetical protein